MSLAVPVPEKERSTSPMFEEEGVFIKRGSVRLRTRHIEKYGADHVTARDTDDELDPGTVTDGNQTSSVGESDVDCATANQSGDTASMPEDVLTAERRDVDSRVDQIGKDRNEDGQKESDVISPQVSSSLSPRSSYREMTVQQTDKTDSSMEQLNGTTPETSKDCKITDLTKTILPRKIMVIEKKTGDTDQSETKENVVPNGEGKAVRVGRSVSLKEQKREGSSLEDLPAGVGRSSSFREAEAGSRSNGFSSSSLHKTEEKLSIFYQDGQGRETVTTGDNVKRDTDSTNLSGQPPDGSTDVTMATKADGQKYQQLVELFESGSSDQTTQKNGSSKVKDVQKPTSPSPSQGVRPKEVVPSGVGLRQPEPSPASSSTRQKHSEAGSITEKPGGGAKRKRQGSFDGKQGKPIQSSATGDSHGRHDHRTTVPTARVQPHRHHAEVKRLSVTQRKSPSRHEPHRRGSGPRVGGGGGRVSQTVASLQGKADSRVGKSRPKSESDIQVATTSRLSVVSKARVGSATGASSATGHAETDRKVKTGSVTSDRHSNTADSSTPSPSASSQKPKPHSEKAVGAGSRSILREKSQTFSGAADTKVTRGRPKSHSDVATRGLRTEASKQPEKTTTAATAGNHGDRKGRTMSLDLSQTTGPHANSESDHHDNGVAGSDHHSNGSEMKADLRTFCTPAIPQSHIPMSPEKEPDPDKQPRKVRKLQGKTHPLSKLTPATGPRHSPGKGGAALAGRSANPFYNTM